MRTTTRRARIDELEQQLELLKDGKINREALAEMFGSMVSRLVPAAPKTNG